MFNTSTSSISYTIKDSNGSILYEGICPYGLLAFIQKIFLTSQDRTMEFTVGTSSFVSSRNFTELQLTDPEYIMTSDETHVSRLAHNDLIIGEEYIKTTSEQEEAFDLWQEQLNQEAMLRQQQLLNDIATQSQILYHQSLISQNQLTEEMARRNNEEAYRLDMLRSQTVTQVAVDPTTAVQALMSEVGSTGDVQRQIAACMKNDIEITKLIIASTATLWANSYDILDVAAKQATTDPAVAHALAEKLDKDSLLYSSLKTLNLIS